MINKNAATPTNCVSFCRSVYVVFPAVTVSFHLGSHMMITFPMCPTLVFAPLVAPRPRGDICGRFELGVISHSYSSSWSNCVTICSYKLFILSLRLRCNLFALVYITFEMLNVYMNLLISFLIRRHSCSVRIHDLEYTIFHSE